MKLSVHLASFYYWFKPYEETLEDRIKLAIDFGFDGVEISNGNSLLNWKPSREILRLLEDKVITLHAELSLGLGLSLEYWLEKVGRLPIRIENITFHPNELSFRELRNLKSAPFHCSLENLAEDMAPWNSISYLRHFLSNEVGLTYDVAHMKNKVLDIDLFDDIRVKEIHLSIDDGKNHYGSWGYSTEHTLVSLTRPSRIFIPCCSLIVLEGIFPPDKSYIQEEVSFVKDMFGGGG